MHARRAYLPEKQRRVGLAFLMLVNGLRWGFKVIVSKLFSDNGEYASIRVIVEIIVLFCL